MQRAFISVAGAIFALAGCGDMTAGLSGGISPAAPAIALFAGEVTAVGPRGYCVDPDSSKPRRGFAMLAPCRTLGVADAPSVTRGITTIQAGPEGSAIVSQNPTEFANYLKGPNGPFVLSRSGNRVSVNVTEVRSFDNHVAVYLRDAAPAHIDGAQEAEWRAFVDIAGRLMTISVRGLDAAPLSASQGAGLLDQAVQAMIAANPAGNT